MNKGKQFFLLLLAAIIGSALTLGVAAKFGGFEKDTFRIEHVNATPGVQTFYKDPKTQELLPLDFTATSKKSMPAVVHIRSTFSTSANSERLPNLPDSFRDRGEDWFFKFFDPDGEREGEREGIPQVGSGSGVIISADGYIVTNNHVIKDAQDIEVALLDKRVYKAEIIGTDPSTDIALIKIQEKDLPALSFVNSDSIQIGEWVVAVGNPLNLNSTVTAGIVSAKGRSINILRDRYRIESFIQTDAVINRGNSGGALVDLQGNLVGINTAIASPSGYYTGYGFAVPSNLVSKVVEDLLEYGKVQRGVLGIIISNIDGNRAKDLGLSVTSGVRVDSLIAEGAAEQAGLKIGDIIYKVNGSSVSDVPMLQEMIATQRPGDEVSLEVLRDNEEKTLTAILKKRSNDVARRSPVLSNDVMDDLGVELETLSASQAEELDIDEGVKVKKLLDGKLKSQTNIKEGFIITKVDSKSIGSVEELANALSRKSGGVMLEGVYEGQEGVHYYAFGM
ncbi:MAG: Do family serine endopeptidase [Bacteroidota bacterium]